jgi:hypothetical protein
MTTTAQAAQFANLAEARRLATVLGGIVRQTIDYLENAGRLDLEHMLLLQKMRGIRQLLAVSLLDAQLESDNPAALRHIKKRIGTELDDTLTAALQEISA